MDSLEKEAIKYQKDGFKIESKRTLKHGSRILLKKKSFVKSEYAYLYHTPDFTRNSVVECLKDYAKIYDELSSSFTFTYSVRGFYFCSTDFDKQVFNDLKQAFTNEDARKYIKAVKLGGETTERLVEKEQPKRKVEKETEEKETEIETPKLTTVIKKIKEFTFHKRPKNEKELDAMLVSFLSASYRHMKTQQPYQNTKIDAEIGKIGIEIKFQPDSGQLDRLYGQVEKYLNHFEKIIVVIGFEKSRETIQYFEERVKKRGWLNDRIFVISVR